MWWEKKTRLGVEPSGIPQMEVPPAPPEVETVMSEPTPKSTNPLPRPANPSGPAGAHTLLGRTAVAQGQLSAGEDLLIEGKFEGTINLDDHCLTVGTEGRVKAEIHARQVIVLGSLNGNVVAREKVDIRRTGRVVGDLVAGTVAIEEGAYFKGSVEMAREDGAGNPGEGSSPSSLRTSA